MPPASTVAKNVAEAKLAGLVGIVLWGHHRDTAALPRIGLPVWSMGTLPAGPRTARPKDADLFEWAAIGAVRATRSDVVVADDDGVVFVDVASWPEVEAVAAQIVADESRQADLIARGTSLRQQLGFADYLARRAADPEYSLRRHLTERGGAIET